MTTFRELNAWKKAMELVDCVYLVAEGLPTAERYALSDQLRRAAVSIPSNIAEGFGRETHADFAHFVAQARGSLYEVDTQLEVAVRRGWISVDAVPKDLMDEVSKLLGALLRHLRATSTVRVPKPQSQSTKHQAQGTTPPALSTKH